MPEYHVIQTKSKAFYDRYERKPDLQHQTHYCPGCGHGVAHKLVAEALAEMDVQDRSIFVSPVGCSVFGYYYFDVGNVQAAHGRAPAVATGLARSRPGSIVISYQGDGDLAAIGTAEIVHAANRGERIAVFFINNAIYGMTGGQMAPTTLVGQLSTTTPWGRRASNEGYPIHVCELLSSLEAPVYIERVSMHDTKNIMRTRKAVRKALELQRDGAGFTLVEILSPCPTIWKMDSLEARRFMEERLIPTFPLKVFRDRRPEPIVEGGPPQRTVAQALGLEANGKPSLAAVGAPAHASRALTMKVAGFGGQGILLLGQMLAEVGMRCGLDVSWLPSYGPEMRSGSAHCHVSLSKDRVGSPLISQPDVVVAMNEYSLRKFAPQVPSGGLVLYNRDSIPADFTPPEGVRIVCVPASEIADRLGSAKAGNIVMMGALIAETAFAPEVAAAAVLEDTIRNAAMLEIDRKALKAGIRHAAGAEAPAVS